MSWRDVLKDMDYTEGEEESYESPSFKKAEAKLRQLITLTIPQDKQMLRILANSRATNVRGIEDGITQSDGQLEMATKRAYQGDRELKEIKKRFADENPQSDDDELLDEMFQDSDSVFATDDGYQMLMNNTIKLTGNYGVQLGFGAEIASGIRGYQQLFGRRNL